MAITQTSPPAGFVQDTASGLIVPQQERIGGEWSGRFSFDSGILSRLDVAGVGAVSINRMGAWLDRDKDTGILNIPPYASGMDDLLNRAIVGGYVANVGYAGVIDPMLSSLVTKLVNMAGTWSPMVTGRRLARRRAIELISRANDSSFGPGEFMRQVAAGFFIDNRGVAFAQLPIHSMPFDSWAQNGMTAVPIEGDDRKLRLSDNTVIPKFYYLQPTNRELRINRTLETVDTLNILPTGIKEWPYWIRKKVNGTSDYAWVLIPRLVGGHITLTSQPANNIYPTYGQSGTWRYISMLVKDILVEDEMVEAFMYGPPEGIVWGTGLDNQTQLKDALIQHHKDKEDAKVSYYPGVIFGGSEAENARIFMLRWRQRPEGFSDADWQASKQDVLAQSMWASIGQIAQRPGDGIATQALIGWDAQSEALFAAVKQLYETIFNWAAVDATVRLIWKSDRSKRSQVDTAEVLSKAIKNMQDSFADGEEKPFTAIEARFMWEQQTGLDVTGGTGDTENEMFSTIKDNTIKLSAMNELPKVDWYAQGDMVVMNNGEVAWVEQDNGRSGLVWVSTAVEGAEILLRRDTLRLIARNVDMGIVGKARNWFDEMAPELAGTMHKEFIRKTSEEISQISNLLIGSIEEVFPLGAPDEDRLYYSICMYLLHNHGNISSYVLAELIRLTKAD